MKMKKGKMKLSEENIVKRKMTKWSLSNTVLQTSE